MAHFGCVCMIDVSACATRPMFLAGTYCRGVQVVRLSAHEHISQTTARFTCPPSNPIDKHGAGCSVSSEPTPYTWLLSAVNTCAFTIVRAFCALICTSFRGRARPYHSCLLAMSTDRLRIRCRHKSLPNIMRVVAFVAGFSPDSARCMRRETNIRTQVPAAS